VKACHSLKRRGVTEQRPTHFKEVGHWRSEVTHLGEQQVLEVPVEEVVGQDR